MKKSRNQDILRVNNINSGQPMNIFRMKELKDLLRRQLTNYYKLPYVIHKRIYLVPQPPHLPRFYYLLKPKSAQIQQAYSQHFPSIIDQQFLQRLLQQDQLDLMIKEYFQLAKKQSEKHAKKLEEYNQTVIYPLHTSYVKHPAFIYYMNAKDYFSEYWKKNQKKYNLTDIYNIFNDLPVQTKHTYEQEFQKKHEQNRLLLIAAQEKYLIPCKKKVYPHILYLSQTYGQVSPSLYKEFKLLEPQQKKEYQEKAKILTKQKQQKFLNFLKNKDLTPLKFKEIKDLCEKIEKLKKNLKEFKKQPQEKQKVEHTMQKIAKLMNEFEDNSMQQKLQGEDRQDIENLEDTEDKVDREGVEDGEDREMEKKYLESMDLDQDEAQIDINALKKKAREIKKQMPKNTE